jgi:nickel transport protein
LTVWAHKVNVFAYVEGDGIRVEGYFSGSAKAKQCRIEVFDAAGNKICEGKTDDDGICVFKLQDLTAGRGDLKFVMHAGTGHLASYTLSSSEIPGAPSGRSATEPKSERQDSRSVRPETGDKEPSPTARTELDHMRDQTPVKQVLEEILETRIRPLEVMLGSQQRLLLEQQRKGPSVTEIVGGIGWILGIVGIAAYFMSLKRMQKRH